MSERVTNLVAATIALTLLGCGNLPKSKEAQSLALASIQFCRDTGGHPSTSASHLDKNFSVTCLYGVY